MNILLAFLHHISFLTIMLALSAEMLLLKLPLTLSTARKIRVYDAIYDVAAGLVLIVGSLRVMYFEKGPTYYMLSIPFMSKMTLFIAVALLSIYPTVTFFKWKTSLREGVVPTISDGNKRKLRFVIHVELTFLALMILCAAMMAKGLGHRGAEEPYRQAFLHDPLVKKIDRLF